MASRDQRGELERELRGGIFQGLLHGLQGAEPAFRRFETWSEVAALISEGARRDAGKDTLLRAIFRGHRQSGDSGWRAVLLLVFWHELEGILRLKRHWDRDGEQLWSNVVWAFMQVITRIDERRRPNGMIQKVVNDTIHRLYEEYSREWRRCRREMPTDPEEIASLLGSGKNDAAGNQLAQEAAVRRLRRYVTEGHLRETDFFLLLGTCVYGSPVAEYARQVGVSYEAARKRRQRALAVLRKLEGRG
jgi:hypothetical protein